MNYLLSFFVWWTLFRVDNRMRKRHTVAANVGSVVYSLVGAVVAYHYLAK